ncbi:hypothetical protein IWQ60_007725 [Tieghemiomyces parasiticus]|uniref:Protein arginine methyltransferase NDUFAF7 n=1 Tax=Tieghemiomyces parasiticus TaxID=78921 RepID=A0A9W7ZVT8_9FUNG|nr:hypothetical protein IWQ60_007725 [Tieghemiomyces parasiticus]
MSIAHYMRQALQSPQGGYYKAHGDVLGAQGDFTTSPEISQMFGELLGVWFVAHWRQRPVDLPIRLVELGPGRGTLMKDMLRAMARFPDFYQQIREVHLIESSTALRRCQHASLLGTPAPANWGEPVSPTLTANNGTSKSTSTPSPPRTVRDLTPLSAAHPSGQFNVVWHHHLAELDRSTAFYNVVVAHEFFDALPVYRFQMTDKGWREIVVDIDDGADSPYHFRFTTSPKASLTSHAILATPRYAKARYQPGDVIETSLDSWAVAHDLAELVVGAENPAASAPGTTGAALIIDYGADHPVTDSLRAISRHKFVHPLTRPGEVDLTADVDFSFLREAVGDRAQCHGPIQQSHFLGRLGIETRLKELLRHTHDPTVQTDLVTSFNRLVDPAFMGRIYKAMAITAPGIIPPAFES